MRKIILLATLFIWVIPYTAYTQDEIGSRYKRNTVYGEFKANRYVFGFYGIGYDRVFGQPNDLVNFSLGWGLSNIDPISSRLFYFSQSAQINCLIGRNAHKLELGMGVSGLELKYFKGNISTRFWEELFHFYRFGYRYQRVNGGPQVRVAFTPTHVMFFADCELLYFLFPLGSVSVGWSF